MVVGMCVRQRGMLPCGNFRAQGLIFHGLALVPDSSKPTLGCVAVTDEEIDEIWNLVPLGTPVEIRP